MAISEHHLIRATIIPEVVRLIAVRFGISEEGALARFYKSATAPNLADEEMGYMDSRRSLFSGSILRNKRRGSNDKQRMDPQGNRKVEGGRHC